MMGTTKLSTIRQKVRESFKMSDAELREWFDRQMKEKAQSAGNELETLRLFRDALLKETKKKRPRRSATSSAK